MNSFSLLEKVNGPVEEGNRGTEEEFLALT